MPRKLRIALAFLAAVLASAGGVAWAQIDEPSACEQACSEQEQACVTACGEQSNPIECEASCRDDGESCRERCL
jgi:hypothetical protein